MFEYNICNQADEEIFNKQCLAIEKHIKHLSKNPILDDVDGSKIQVYFSEKGKITVYNDYSIGAVYVNADFDLLPYFQ